MPKTSKRVRTADVTEMASRGEDVSMFFTNKFTVVRPVRRVNIDLTQGMLRELDGRAAVWPSSKLCWRRLWVSQVGTSVPKRRSAPEQADGLRQQLPSSARLWKLKHRAGRVGERTTPTKRDPLSPRRTGDADFPRPALLKTLASGMHRPRFRRAGPTHQPQPCQLTDGPSLHPSG